MEKINIAEILKDCPQGMELDCTIWDNEVKVFLKEVRNADFTFPIVVTVKVNNIEYSNSFTKYGAYNDYPYCKCVLFPKGKTTWEGFVPPCQFKDGDVLYIDCTTEFNVKQYEYIFIFNRIYNDQIHSYCHYYMHNGFNPKATYFNKYPIRFATEEEKARLFQAIKDNGYKWDEETKTLEKLPQPKFKVGDRIRKKGDYISGFITLIDSDNFYKVEYGDGGVSYANVEAQDEYELVPNKFDISTLVPFESKVLVRNDESQYWIPAFWGYKRDDGYTTTFGWSKYCVPFDRNENLLGTNNDCDEYFKNWD